MTTAEPGKATTTTATIIGLVLFLSCAPAFARDANVLNAWECDNGIAVELRREAVHTFEIRLEFATPYPAEKKPLSEYRISRITERLSVISISSLPDVEQCLMANLAGFRAQAAVNASSHSRRQHSVAKW